jgi:hypothetical protein
MTLFLYVETIFCIPTIHAFFRFVLAYNSCSYRLVSYLFATTPQCVAREFHRTCMSVQLLKNQPLCQSIRA